MSCFYYSCVLLFILITSSSATAIDTIYSNQTLKDGETIVSATQIFQLGFFSLGNSSLRYLGIWYNNISKGTVVWVANRGVPNVGATGMLKVNDDGTLQLLSVSNNHNTLVWSSPSSKPVTNTSNLVAQLLDDGNLVVKDEISGNLVWQSFDYPGDTLLPGMKLGVDLVTGTQRYLTSWKSRNDPSASSYTVWMDVNGYPQLYNMKDGSSYQQRLGSWNGLGFSGMRGLGPSSFYDFEFVLNHEEIYYRYTLVNNSFYTRMTLDAQGGFYQLVWSDQSQSWVSSMMTFLDVCERYALCGVYGSCSINHSPGCECLEGFEPKQPEQWSHGDWSSGCKHMTTANGHNFNKLSNMKLPDSRNSWFNNTMSLGECENVCTRNDSCTAYANTDIRGGGSGCLLWFSELIDIREAPQGDGSGQDLYVKVFDTNIIGDKKTKKKSQLKVILSTVFPVFLLSFALILYVWRTKKKSHHKAFINEEQKQDLDLPLFSLGKMVKATSNFSINNKLGQGGFGAVYKGVLEEGGEIAVKRLSKTSR